MSRLSVMRRMAARQVPEGPSAGALASLSEIFAPGAAEGAAAGFVLAHVSAARAPVLWVQDRLSRLETGRPYLPGLGLAAPLLYAALDRPADVLTALEEGLRCQGLAAVVGEVWGEPPALGFAAGKRLAFRAEAAGIPCWLIRRAAEPGLGAARERWRIATLPSEAHPDDPAAPGAPRWRAERFRSRLARPGEWVVRHERAGEDGAAGGTAGRTEGRAEDHLDFSALAGDRTLAGAGGTPERRAAR